MDKPIIEIKNISKKYNIKHQQGGYVALRDVLTNVAKNPFKFLYHKTKEAVGKESNEEFWALKDINFNIKKGDTIGIIGHNGAGKSTLLKILTGITPPTTGKIKMRGRVASLLEVGTGFHPELTGRENIFLNGAILGMTKKEIASKFDEIVKFSGIGKFLDTPVKRYSSGMYVRLAFSVAAHMEPDILLVDEVLAVGDAEFQKKCLGKMNEVTKKAGRTIIFVSHNMEAIKNLCNKCVLLEKGRIKNIGKTQNIINQYLQNQKNSKLIVQPKNKNLILDNLLFSEQKNIFTIHLKSKREIKKLTIGIGINNIYGQRLTTLIYKEDSEKIKLKKGKNTIECEINYHPFKTGAYIIDIFITDKENSIIFIKQIKMVNIIQQESSIINLDESQGDIIIKQNWRIYEK